MALSPIAIDPSVEAEFDDADALLAAVGNDGKLFVWSLVSMDGTLEPAQALAVDEGAPTTRPELSDRIAWRPCAPESGSAGLVLASVLADGVSLTLWAVRLGETGGAQEPAALALEVGSSPLSDGAVRDIAFTPDGAALAVALSAEVRIFDLSSLTAAAILNGSAAASAAFAVLHTGGVQAGFPPIESVRPVAPGSFVIGSDGNRVLSLWAQPTSGGACARVDSIELSKSGVTGNGGYSLVSCVPPPPPGKAPDKCAPPLLLLCGNKSVIVVSTALLNGSPRFGGVSAYYSKLPVLSFCATLEAKVGEADGSVELSAFAVQPTAVQRLGFKPETLPPSTAAADVEAPAAQPPTPAVEAAAPAAPTAPAAVQTPADASTSMPTSGPPSAPSPFLEAALRRLASKGSGPPPVPPPTPASGALPAGASAPAPATVASLITSKLQTLAAVAPVPPIAVLSRPKVATPTAQATITTSVSPPVLAPVFPPVLPADTQGSAVTPGLAVTVVAKGLTAASAILASMPAVFFFV